jgi:2-deoxy-D-gluconate 3-dehydrogenase
MSGIFEISGKKAIVTGGSQGLGYGMGKGLAEQGVEVVLIDISAKVKDAAAEVAAQTHSGHMGHVCHGVVADLATQSERERAFDEALALLGGRLDIIVNAAGIQRRHHVEDFPLKDWNDVLNVNLTAVFSMCQLATRVMLRQGSGKIINIASVLTFFGGYTVPAYAASKGGVAQMTKAFANELASKGINVNAIAPGYMATEMNTALINDPGRNTEILARIPAGRWGTGEDVAGVACFLASGAADYVHGAVIPVDGGYLSR